MINRTRCVFAAMPIIRLRYAAKDPLAGHAGDHRYYKKRLRCRHFLNSSSDRTMWWQWDRRELARVGIDLRGP